MEKFLGPEEVRRLNGQVYSQKDTMKTGEAAHPQFHETEKGLSNLSEAVWGSMSMTNNSYS